MAIKYDPATAKSAPKQMNFGGAVPIQGWNTQGSWHSGQATSPQSGGSAFGQASGGTTGAWQDIKDKQDWAMNTQLSAIDKLKQSLATNPAMGSLGQNVQGQLANPSDLYANAANAQLARAQGAIGTGAAQSQQDLQNNLAARGQARSGLAGQQVQNIERDRLSGMANVQNQTREAIASRAFSDQMAANTQGMNYLNMLSNQGNANLSQQGNVLGNIQYTQPPQQQGNPYQGAIMQLQQRLRELQGGGEELGNGGGAGPMNQGWQLPPAGVNVGGGPAGTVGGGIFGTNSDLDDIFVTGGGGVSDFFW